MTERAIIHKPDLRKAAEVANETGCAIEIRLGGSIWKITPQSNTIANTVEKKPVDMSDGNRM